MKYKPELLTTKEYHSKFVNIYIIPHLTIFLTSHSEMYKSISRQLRDFTMLITYIKILLDCDW